MTPNPGSKGSTWGTARLLQRWHAHSAALASSPGATGATAVPSTATRVTTAGAGPRKSHQLCPAPQHCPAQPVWGRTDHGHEPRAPAPPAASPAVPPCRGAAGTRAWPWSKTVPLILSMLHPRLGLTLTLPMLNSLWQSGGVTAPKIEMCSQLLHLVQEKYSIPCLESSLLLITIENAACFETNCILCRLECRLFLLVYYASHVLVYRKSVYLKDVFF